MGGWWACWKKPTMTASVRIDDESFDRLKQLSEEEDRPMTRIVRAAIDAYDQIKLAKATSGSPKKAEKQPVLRSEDESPSSDCPHPEDRQKTLPWGTLCGVCGVKIR